VNDFRGNDEMGIGHRFISVEKKRKPFLTIGAIY